MNEKEKNENAEKDPNFDYLCDMFRDVTKFLRDCGVKKDKIDGDMVIEFIRLIKRRFMAAMPQNDISDSDDQKQFAGDCCPYCGNALGGTIPQKQPIIDEKPAIQPVIIQPSTTNIPLSPSDLDSIKRIVDEQKKKRKRDERYYRAIWKVFPEERGKVWNVNNAKYHVESSGKNIAISSPNSKMRKTYSIN